MPEVCSVIESKRLLPNLENFSIHSKLFLLVSVLLVSVSVIHLLSQQFFKDALYESRKEVLRSVVTGTANQLQSVAERDDISPAEQMQLASDLIKGFRYGEGNYLYLFTSQGISISHPLRPDIEGQPLSSLSDSIDISLLKEMISKAASTGNGYWTYQWLRPGDSQPTDKLSYAMHVAGTDWVIGSGYFTEDIEGMLNDQHTLYVALLAITAIFTFILSGVIARSISLPAHRTVKQIDQLASGNLDILITDTMRRDEFGTIARALAHFQEQSHENRELKDAQEYAKYLEAFDPTTQLLSRKALGDQLSHILKNNHPGDRTAILVIKVPLLRDILSQWEVNASRAVVTNISERLCQSVASDDLVARHGDDSFAVVRPRFSTNEELRNLTAAIQQSIMDPQADSQSLAFNSRIGISISPNDGDQELLLISHAEEALSEARRLELDYMLFEQLKTLAVDERLAMWKDIQEAIEQDQFHLVFQPLFDLKTNKLVSAEVLLRWQHPRRGFVSPASFITFAEQSGLVSRLDKWVIAAAAKQLDTWRQDGLDAPTLAINLSGITFTRSDLREVIDSAIEPYNFPAHALELELTEGVLIESIEVLQEKIEQLKARHISLSIDDFGTGYSSLSRIRNLAINKVKIDRSFIDELDENIGDQKIVEAIIHMAHGLGFEVVAEGVETLEQLSQLRHMNCDIVQGFFLSKPLPVDKFEQMLEDQNIVVEVD